MPYAKTSLRAEQRALREEMRALGMSHRQIAVEFGRRYRLRPRAAWRHAHGWSLTEAAQQINAYAARTGLEADGVTVVAMTSAHLCEHENWPGQGGKPTGRRPTPYLLSLLAAVNGCTVHDLLDVADYRLMPPADRLVIDKTTRADGQDDPTAQPGAGSEQRATRAQAEESPQTGPKSLAASWTAEFSAPLPSALGSYGSAADDEVAGSAIAMSAARGPQSPRQRIIEPSGRPHQSHDFGADLQGADLLARMSERTLVIAAAHESSEHAGRAEASNVGQATLEQLEADVRRLAGDYMRIPPLPMFGEMLRVRDRVYVLLAGRQKPAATAQLHLLAVRPAGQRQHRSGPPGRSRRAGASGLGIRGDHRSQRAMRLDTGDAGIDRVLVRSPAACGAAGAKCPAPRRLRDCPHPAVFDRGPYAGQARPITGGRQVHAGRNRLPGIVVARRRLAR